MLEGWDWGLGRRPLKDSIAVGLWVRRACRVGFSWRAALVTWRFSWRYERGFGVACWGCVLGVRMAIPRVCTRSLQPGWRVRAGLVRTGVGRGRVQASPAAIDRDFGLT